MRTLFTIIFLTIFGLNNINAATFSSVSSGTWSISATWNIISGTDTDLIPDIDDDVIINGGHTIDFTRTESAKTILNNGGIIGNGKNFNLFGNFTNNGSVSGIKFFYIQAACVFSSSVNFNGASYLWVAKNLTINAGTNITVPSGIIINATVNNFGSVSSLKGLSMNSVGTWINASASTLSLSANSSTIGTLDASAVGNTVIYMGTSRQIKNATSYYNLVLNGATTKSVTTNLVVSNDLTIGAGSTNIFNLNTNNLSVGGNWTNNSNNTILNQGTITFNGSGTQTLVRISNEVINNMILGGTGTVLLGTSVTSNNLTINNGNLDLSASNYTVNVSGNLVNNGSLNARSGLFNFNGSSAQTISGTSATSFFNINSSNVVGVSVTSSSTISNILTVSAGLFGTSGAGTIRIPATGATTYGRIGMVGGSLIGNGWTIESFIQGPAPKGWQWLSSPINGNTLADWDNDTRFWMSGVGGNDGSAAGFKSVRTWNAVTGGTVAVTTTATALTPGEAFYVWMADNTTTGLTAPLIYNSVGQPNFGTITFPVNAGPGSVYNLVGNPYACPINYSTVVAASGNLSPNFLILLENGTYSTNPNSGVIAPNQGFFCIANSTGNIQFTEASKNIITNPNILRNSPQNNSVTFNVYNNINGLGGQTSIEFSESSADVFESNKDLSFIASPYEDADNIWTSSNDSKYMLWNSLNNSDNKKDVPLTVKSGVYGLHTISVKGVGSLTNYNSVIIEDLTTGKKIDLMKEQNYDFNAEEIGKEYNFVVHFSKNNKADLTLTKTIQENTLDNNTNVYNTASNVVVKFDMVEDTPVQISVYNLSGQQVIQPININVTNNRIVLPLQKENGLYLLIIKSKDQQISRKIIF